MVILDTSFIFALFVREDDFHLKAISLIKRFESELIYCSFLVFQETMTLMMSKLGSEAAASIVSNILGEDSPIKLLKVDQEYSNETFELFSKLSPHRFSYVDVSLMVLSREFEAEVLTFDRRLEEKLKAP